MSPIKSLLNLGVFENIHELSSTNIFSNIGRVRGLISRRIQAWGHGPRPEPALFWSLLWSLGGSNARSKSSRKGFLWRRPVLPKIIAYPSNGRGPISKFRELLCFKIYLLNLSEKKKKRKEKVHLLKLNWIEWVQLGMAVKFGFGSHPHPQGSRKSGSAFLKMRIWIWKTQICTDPDSDLENWIYRYVFFF